MNQQEFLKVAQKSHFFDKHSRVLVAVSGGRDSMALLEMLYKTQEKLGISLGIVHVNHHQRSQAQEEERYIKNLSHQLQLPFYLDHFQGEFTEKKARDFRYAFFKRTMEQEGYTALVTAHHADDQAETVFMRLLRGSLLKDLTGIQAVQPFGIGELIRPFLAFKKADLPEVFHFEDESNVSSRYLRNRIRHQYLPVLEIENPQFSNHLLHLSKEISCLQEALRDVLGTVDLTNLTYFSNQTPAVQFFLLQEYLETFPDLQLTKRQFLDLLHILQTKASYQGYLKSGYFILKNYQEFSLTKINPQTDRQNSPFVIDCPGIYTYGEWEISLDKELKDSDMIFFVDFQQPLLLRSRQSGDKIVVNGVSKKVRRYFIDEKISLPERQAAVVVEQNGNIYGIFNIVASDLSKSLKNDTIKSVLSIKRRRT